ncbi:MAG: glycosyltransferase family 4 protein, partial [Sphingomonadaceae bacterium]
FALSSDSEQFPLSMLEAMAAGVPAISTDVGDVREMVVKDNLPFVTPVEDEAAYSAALQTLAGDAALRAALGAANREKAQARFDEKEMIAAYSRLYASAMGRPDRL